MDPAATLPALRTLRAALLLLLLVVACRPSTDEALAIELRCHCPDIMHRIQLNKIQSLTTIAPGPACPQTQVIVTIKNGDQVCLNFKRPWVKKIIKTLRKKKTSK